MRKAPVTLYTFPECKDPCQMARDVLNKRGVPFKEKLISNQQMLDELKQVSGGLNVPVLVVGSQVETTASPQAFNQALDIGGYPAAGYDQVLLHAAEQTTIGAPVSLITWHYPPSFLMLVLPLGMLSYPSAAVLWVAATFVAFALLLQRIAPHPLTSLAALIFPATAQCLISGQNGAFSAGLIAGGLLSLESRPVLSGLCWGLLSYKPQMAMAGFAALVFGRHWRALGVALIVAAALAGSALVLSIPLTTPYAYDYDLVMLLLPLAWLIQEARATGFRPGEPLLLIAAWAMPVAGKFIAEATRLQPTWLILLVLLLMTWRRASFSAPSARS